MNTLTTSRSLYSALALAGAIPFVAAALLPLFNITALPVAGELDAMAASYGLAIASFMAGTHWGVFLARAHRAPVNLLVVSNVIVLAVWFAYLGSAIHVALGVQGAAFAALLYVDYLLGKADIISVHYLRVRTAVTALVIASLILTAIFSGR